MSPTKIVTICGSTRVASLNRLLLQFVPSLAPPEMVFEELPSIAELPHYNQDLDHDPVPPVVARFRQAIREADGVVISTPEYSHGVPGVVKNALEWASRPVADIPFVGKCAAVFVATPSRSLGLRALVELTRLLRDMCNYVVTSPEVVITQAHTKLTVGLDGTVELRDPFSSRLIQAQLRALGVAIEHGAGTLALAGIRAYEDGRLRDSRTNG